ncbi:MAG: 2OG-Fe(II) oxygenase [Gammaproteobacteria bacterium]|nr:2OG-Fe(II) oxygenase [Gammaproteobacteria bacterium]
MLSSADTVRRFRRNGYLVIEHGMDSRFCRQVIEGLRGASMIEVPTQNNRGDTYFLTLNGQELVDRISVLAPLYERFGEIVNAVSGDEFAPLDTYEIGLSLNYTPPGGEFVRHFDRNEMTVSLYFNEVEGGELVVWPKILSPILRIFGEKGKSAAVRLSQYQKGVSITPRVGTIVIFSKQAVHAVAPVLGNRARVSVIMAYDRPGKSFQADRDYYGHGHDRVTLADPAV